MTKIKKLTAIILTFAVVISLFTFSSGAIESQEEWIQNNWSEIAASKGSIIMTPGTDNSEMNFSWQSSITGFKAKLMVGKSEDMSDAEEIKVKSFFNIFLFEFTHEATATDLERDTTYYYKYYADRAWSDVYSFTTASSDATKVLLITDAQVGRYRKCETDEENLQHDIYELNRTLELATQTEDNINFILSVGDQVQDSYSEKHYSAFESASLFRNYPVAAAIGNHEFYTTNYFSHYNNPNRKTSVPLRDAAGNGYYFLYNDILFIVLDSNFMLPATHRAIVKAACEAYPDAKWRVVAMHHSPYDVNASDDFFNNLSRYTIAPILDEYDIDLCVGGHDHLYSRSYIVKNNKATSDVAVDDVYTNPDGTLYITATTASGCNYNNVNQDEIEPQCDVWWQQKLPGYSIIDVVGDKLTVTTRETVNNTVIDSVSIVKN